MPAVRALEHCVAIRGPALPAAVEAGVHGCRRSRVDGQRSDSRGRRTASTQWLGKPGARPATAAGHAPEDAPPGAYVHDLRCRGRNRKSKSRPAFRPVRGPPFHAPDSRRCNSVTGRTRADRRRASGDTTCQVETEVDDASRESGKQEKRHPGRSYLRRPIHRVRIRRLHRTDFAP